MKRFPAYIALIAALVLGDQSMAFQLLSKNCSNKAKASIPQGYTIPSHGGILYFLPYKNSYDQDYQDGGYGRANKTSDSLLKRPSRQFWIRTGLDDSWSSCSEAGAVLRTYERTWQCGKYRINGIPDADPNALVVYDKHRNAFEARIAGRKRGECKVSGILSFNERGEDKNYIHGYEEEVRKYTIERAGVSFYGLVRMYFTVPISRGPDF